MSQLTHLSDSLMGALLAAAVSTLVTALVIIRHGRRRQSLDVNTLSLCFMVAALSCVGLALPYLG